jgi:hypothetical protein
LVCSANFCDCLVFGVPRSAISSSEEININININIKVKDARLKRKTSGRYKSKAKGNSTYKGKSNNANREIGVPGRGLWFPRENTGE